MNDMIDFIHAQAMEKFAGNKEAADEFVEGFLKEASSNWPGPNSFKMPKDFGPFKPFVSARPISGAPETFRGIMSSETAKTIGKVGVGLAAGLLGAGLIGAINHYRTTSTSSTLRRKFEAALAQVMATNKVVKGVSQDKAKNYAETIFKFAPNVAADVNLLSSILANAVLGEGIDQMTIKNLVDLEGRYMDNMNPSQIQSFKV